jgi:hypothetical protein
VSPTDVSLLINGGVAGIFAAFAIVLIREIIRYLAKRDELFLKLVEYQKLLADKLSDLTVVIANLKGSIDDCPSKELTEMLKAQNHQRTRVNK